MEPPTESAITALNAFMIAMSYDDKVKIPQKRSEVIDLRNRLVKAGMGTEADFKYIEWMLRADDEGYAAFEPEIN